MFVLSVVFELYVFVFNFSWKVKYLHPNLRFYMTRQTMRVYLKCCVQYLCFLSLKAEISSSQSTFVHDASNACLSQVERGLASKCQFHRLLLRIVSLAIAISNAYHPNCHHHHIIIIIILYEYIY